VFHLIIPPKRYTILPISFGVKMKKASNSQQKVKDLIKEFGETFSASLGIKLQNENDSEIFKWFLASVLFGKRISWKIAAKTYREFEKNNVLSPKVILDTGWDGLVKILDDGGYVRYDFSTATKLLELSEQLPKKYGCLTELHKKAKDQKDLENKLMQFKGIGVVTTNIFLRELRTVWKKANPTPLEFIEKQAIKHGINLNQFNRKTKTFVALEAALIRSCKQK